MGTEVIRVEPGVDPAAAVEAAAAVLRRGGLVGLPTETVYGVGGRADLESARRALHEVKERSAGKPFTVHIALPGEAEWYVPGLRGVGARLARKGWPGPLTLLLRVAEMQPAPALAGLDAETPEALYHEGVIGLRCPDHRVAQAILAKAGGPVVLASANRAGRRPPVTADEVLAELDGRMDVLVDAGRTRHGRASTVVRVESGRYEIVREGVYDARMLDRLARVTFLFVCTGNTCRSPMAAGIARKLLAERLGCSQEELASRGVVVESAGTAGGFGGAAEHAVTVMGRRGVDVTGHRSQALTTEMVREADHVFVMTEGHRAAVLQLDTEAGQRVALLLDAGDVADPIGGTEQDYEACANVLEAGLHARLREIEL
ncbi:MAG TPA: L-threonylcarbamoyladenylate synthase [Phycisphaerae bacterium]|nr:L-threonylcarbamoyladenylate synthase [Phycisphaerae bacterium]HNU45878.1 L-threonylcarbamoyladenylate synthase [Phycisphaerae bacterium]